jgi:hypothetical protein
LSENQKPKRKTFDNPIIFLSSKTPILYPVELTEKPQKGNLKDTF